MTSAISDLQPDFCESPLNALVVINAALGPQRPDQLFRAVNFMYYELASKTEGRGSDEVFAALNHFFFHTKSFRVGGGTVLLNDVIEQRVGCPAALALLYIHLGHQLGLRLELIHWPLHSFVKWECQGKSRFVDLEQNGKLLCEEELLQIINRHKDQVQALSVRQSVMEYLTYLSFYFRERSELDLLHKTLGLILSAEPENTRYLAERALLRRELGLIKDALQDMKRYFSFNDESLARHELLEIYEELKARAPALN